MHCTKLLRSYKFCNWIRPSCYGDVKSSCCLHCIHCIYNNNNNNNNSHTPYGIDCSQNRSNGARVARMPVDRYASEYNMRHSKRGLAIIFNHEHFEIMSLKSRTGTNVDCENLRNTLERLQFDVVVHKDFRYGEIQQRIEEREYLRVCFTFYNNMDIGYWMAARICSLLLNLM